MQKLLMKPSQEQGKVIDDIVLFRKVKHVNLLQLTGYCLIHEGFLLVYEYAGDKNLADILLGTSNWTIIPDNYQDCSICLETLCGKSSYSQGAQHSPLDLNVHGSYILVTSSCNTTKHIMVNKLLVRPMVLMRGPCIVTECKTEFSVVDLQNI